MSSVLNLLVDLLVVPVTQELDEADAGTTHQTSSRKRSASAMTLENVHHTLRETMRDDMKLFMNEMRESQRVFLEAFGNSMNSLIGALRPPAPAQSYPPQTSVQSYTPHASVQSYTPHASVQSIPPQTPVRSHPPQAPAQSYTPHASVQSIPPQTPVRSHPPQAPAQSQTPINSSHSYPPSTTSQAAPAPSFSCSIQQMHPHLNQLPAHGLFQTWINVATLQSLCSEDKSNILTFLVCLQIHILYIYIYTFMLLFNPVSTRYSQ